MLAETKEREAVGLTEKEQQAMVKLVETYNRLENDTDRLVALAFLEGMAAASAPTPPKATA